MWCICALILVQPMAVFATILGPGLLTPVLVWTDKTSPGGNGDQTKVPDLNDLDEKGPDSNDPDENDSKDPEPTIDSAEILKAEQRKAAREDAEKAGFLVLINKVHTVDSNYKPDDLASIKYFASNRSESGRYMRQEAADHFHQLVEAAAEEGYTIVLTTAYRSYGFQKVLWDNYVAKDGEAAASRYSARPGTSEHQSGLAVDVSSPSVSYELTQKYADTAEGKWLAANAHKFGFIIRYPKGMENITGYMYEPWHLRYVGQSVAEEIFEEGITLEEYLILHF